MIQSTLNKGFSLTFENGLTISVQFGSVNYCANKDNSIGNMRRHLVNDITECINAEIAIWDTQDRGFDFGSGTVKGYITANEVADWIIRTKNAKNIITL